MDLLTKVAVLRALAVLPLLVFLPLVVATLVAPLAVRARSGPRR